MYAQTKLLPANALAIDSMTLTDDFAIYYTNHVPSTCKNVEAVLVPTLF